MLMPAVPGVSRHFSKDHSLTNEPVRIFPHLINNDGTFDCICPICFLTVASAPKESQLSAIEREHICEQGDLVPAFREFKDKQLKKIT
jgi:hypothetical protein